MIYTLNELRSRHSVRSYSLDQIDPAIIQKLESEVTFINSHEAGLNFQLVTGNPEPFKGFTRSYGFFKNVSNFLACIVDTSFPHTLERAGYFAQQFVMAALGCGLGTCYVGGTFSREQVKVQTHVYESIPFVVTFGYPAVSGSTVMSRLAMRMIHRNDLKPRDFFVGGNADYDKGMEKYPCLEKMLEAVVCAPSSLNKQPVRLRLDNQENLISYTEPKKDDSIDLGIAKFNMMSVSEGLYFEWGQDAPLIV